MTTPTKAESLSDRIRSEAAIADRPGQMARLEAIAVEVDRLQRGARTLGDLVHFAHMRVVAATNSQDLLDENGDGDWGAIWDRLDALASTERTPA